MESDKSKREIDKDPVRRANPFDTATGYSGQDYHRDREAELAADDPAGGKPASERPEDPDADTPPEAGKRASFDPESGAVHGSGAGAGGGNPGEDYDDDPQAGGGYPRTGVESDAAKRSYRLRRPNRFHRPHRLMTKVDTAFARQIIDVPQRQRELHIHRHHQPDHLKRKLKKRNGLGALGLIYGLFSAAITALLAKRRNTHRQEKLQRFALMTCPRFVPAMVPPIGGSRDWHACAAKAAISH